MTKKRFPAEEGEPQLKARLPEGDTVTVEALGDTHSLVEDIQPKYQVIPDPFLLLALKVEHPHLDNEDAEKAVKFGIKKSIIPAHALAGYACSICGSWIPSDQLTRRINLLKNTGDPELIKLGFLAESIIYRRDNFDKQYTRVIPVLTEARILKYAVDFTTQVKEVIDPDILAVLERTAERLDNLILFLEELSNEM